MTADPVVRTATGEPLSFDLLLQTLRMDRGLSQPALARLLAAVSGMPTIDRSHISRWERGERIPSTFWLNWLAVVLQTPLGTLLAARDVSHLGRRKKLPGLIVTRLEEALKATADQWREEAGLTPSYVLTEFDVRRLTGLCEQAISAQVRVLLLETTLGRMATVLPDG